MKKQNKHLFIFQIILVSFLILFLSSGCEKEDPVELPTLTTLSVTEITSNSAKSGGNIINNGGAEVTSRGLVWGATANLSLEQHAGLTVDESGTGLFTTNLSTLTSNTTYYVRSYAINSAGTAYGNEIQFKTLGEVATLTTANVTGISATSATSGGNITDDGGAEVTARGVCWNTDPNPTVDNWKTTDGKGTGSFTSNLTDLSPNTTYYVRAYSINSIGTSYGNELEFTTQAELPSVTTSSITNITQNSTTGGGNVTSNGGAIVTSRGICWSTSQNPTTGDNHTTDGSGTSTFTSNITGLSANTTYYVRAYATNSAGTSYGEQKSFTTYGDVTNPATGQTWLNRNLGASRLAISSTDAQSYCHLYQWGRAADGHQIRISGITSILSSSNSPGHGYFIITTDSPNDWRSPQNDNLWQGVNGINNPCPVGFRLPSAAELDLERQSWSSDNAAGAFASPLRLPLAGCRYLSNGSFLAVGSFGWYWSSTIDGIRSQSLNFNSSDAGMTSPKRALGFSVRCIKD